MPIFGNEIEAINKKKKKKKLQENKGKIFYSEYLQSSVCCYRIHFEYKVKVVTLHNQRKYIRIYEFLTLTLTTLFEVNSVVTTLIPA